MEETKQIVLKSAEPSLIEMQKKLVEGLLQGRTFPRFTDLGEFREFFSLGNQLQLVSNRPLCFFGPFPTLEHINDYFKANVAEVWLIVQIKDLCSFSMERELMDDYHLDLLSFMIVDKYGFLKVSELSLFFYEAKGKKFYGKVSPSRILELLDEFIATTRKEANDKRIKEAEDLYYAERKKYASYQPDRMERIMDTFSKRKPKIERKPDAKEDKAVFNSVINFLNGCYNLSDEDRKKFESAFEKNHKCSIQDYVNKRKED